MKKGSSMGGGEFEFNPHNFDEKINRRNEFIDKNFKYLREELERLSDEYSNNGLGIKDNFKECIIQMLIKDFRGIT